MRRSLQRLRALTYKEVVQMLRDWRTLMLLFALPLPDYDQTFAAMGNFRGVHNLLADYSWAPPFYGATYEHPTASFEELSLSFVRTVCLLASRDGKGVLWGNDVYVHET